jgi:hypothetical protein
MKELAMSTMILVVSLIIQGCIGAAMIAQPISSIAMVSADTYNSGWPETPILRFSEADA